MTFKNLIKNSKKLVLDTGIFIEYFKTKDNKVKKYLREILFTEDSEVKIYANYILKSEIYYILCRVLGKEKAEELLNEIELFLIFEESKDLYELVGQIKCKFSISLVDCYSIATGIVQSCPILFIEEEELSEDIVEQINRDFKSEILVLNKNNL